MTIPADFQFSQGSLQDYVDCPRRFQLRYVRRVAWPAPEAEPVLESERLARMGAVFHRLIHQHLLGIPAEQLVHMASDDTLRHWWRNYLVSGPSSLPSSRYPEVLLSAPVSGYRLVAKYDLVAVDTGRRGVIVDWKTSRKRPRREWLAGRLQTQVYPYLLVQAGAYLNAGQPFGPGQVEMVYWFADFPDDPERFVYDAAQYRADEARLTSLIEEIAGLGDEDFLLTNRDRRCDYCCYRSLCRRGVEAGSVAQIDEEGEPVEGLAVSLDFEQIAEIEF